jgi:uncharacterized protein (DUF1330 family)
LSVYVLTNLVINDQVPYRSYELAFRAILAKAPGKLLSVCDQPEVVEGQWPFARTVLLWFPSRQAASKLYASAEYRAIVPDRWRSTRSNVVLLDAFEH